MNPKKSSKETKSILHSDIQIAMLIDLLIDAQILIDISFFYIFQPKFFPNPKYFAKLSQAPAPAQLAGFS